MADNNDIIQMLVEAFSAPPQQHQNAQVRTGGTSPDSRIYNYLTKPVGNGEGLGGYLHKGILGATGINPEAGASIRKKFQINANGDSPQSAMALNALQYPYQNDERQPNAISR
jgi:hypothetical protein